jgi:hypothetical protein
MPGSVMFVTLLYEASVVKRKALKSMTRGWRPWRAVEEYAECPRTCVTHNTVVMDEDMTRMLNEESIVDSQW